MRLAEPTFLRLDGGAAAQRVSDVLYVPGVVVDEAEPVGAESASLEHCGRSSREGAWVGTGGGCGSLGAGRGGAPLFFRMRDLTHREPIAS